MHQHLLLMLLRIMSLRLLLRLSQKVWGVGPQSLNRLPRVELLGISQPAYQVLGTLPLLQRHRALRDQALEDRSLIPLIINQGRRRLRIPSPLLLRSMVLRSASSRRVIPP
ncbi:hypothetical protein PsorP6_017689 [Peronosclerospora sorghi]|uniref:Uncharacterized protein n=1 Tax=Peronosclerospora sorghi TaxID=230839 RepID=A0ACC0WNS6_9STRA|nr:hypothetical protein PsorP6_017689 [Peronosclerospora sorghi]